MYTLASIQNGARQKVPAGAAGINTLSRSLAVFNFFKSVSNKTWFAF